MISDVRPEGGFQDPEAHAALYARLSSWKEPPRCMFPAEFLRIITDNLNPRWTSCGIASTRFGAAERKFAGLAPHGTVWFASPYQREWDISIPAGCIPYSTVKTAEWDEHFMRWKPRGEMVRGWRSALEQLIEQGHLRPSLEVSWYMGRNSHALCPKQWGGGKHPIEDEPPESYERFTRILSMYIETPDTTSYGSTDGDAVVARKDYREIEKEVKDYA